MAKHTKLSKHEKIFLISVSVFVTLILCIALLCYARDINPVISVPTPALPKPNGLDYYLQASNKLADIRVMVGAIRYTYSIDNIYAIEAIPPGTPMASWAVKYALVNAQSSAMATLHQGFTFDYHAIPIRSFAQRNEHFIFQRRLRYMLFLAGCIKAQNGDWGSATDLNLDAVQLGEEIQHGGDIKAFCVGGTCQRLCRPPIWTAIPHLTAVQARHATQRMEFIIRRTPPLAEILQEDKYKTLAILNGYFHQPNWRKEFFTGHEDNFVKLRMFFCSKHDILVYFTRKFDESIACSKQSYYACKVPLLYRSLTENQIDDDDDINLLGRIFCDYTTRNSYNAMLLVSFALQAYHEEHGRYPATLRELTPAYLSAIPNDPFASNQPLRYKRTGAHYLLYSIGPDGIDDGGKASSDGQQANSRLKGVASTIMPESKGDIVAGVNVE